MKQLFLIILIIVGSVIISQEKLYIIPIHGDIEPSLTIFIRNGIKEANKAGAHILFDINTFGGRVDSALQITTLIGSVKDRKTIAFIPADPEGLGVSWSAGALISFACTEIYMAEGTSIGAAAPVYIGAEGTKAAEEKTVSAVRVQMQSLAEKNGYPTAIALAMVDKDVELYEIKIDGNPHLITKKDLVKDSESTLFLASGKLLTLSAKQMEYFGVSNATVTGLDNILEDLNISDEDVVRFDKNIPDRLITFLTSTTILALLMTLGLVAIYLELTSPGFGILGAIGLIAFSIVFIGGELMGTLDSLELLIFLLGIGLIIVEIFVIPGFGIIGISGIISIGLALVLSQQDFFIPEWQWQWSIFNRSLLSVFIAFIASLGIISLLMFLFPRVSLFNRLILNTPNTPKQVELGEEPQELYGITVTKLRPVGKIKTYSGILEAKSEGAFIECGINVQILSRVGNRVVVKEGTDETTI